MVYPTRDEFRQKARQGNLIPLHAEVFADLETPVSAFLKLRRGGFNFLLESVEGGQQMARYSFLGRDPSLIFEARGNLVTVRRGADIESRITEDPLGDLEALLHGLNPPTPWVLVLICQNYRTRQTNFINRLDFSKEWDIASWFEI